jgi:hypothetical protein
MVGPFQVHNYSEVVYVVRCKASVLLAAGDELLANPGVDSDTLQMLAQLPRRLCIWKVFLTPCW